MHGYNQSCVGIVGAHPLGILAVGRKLRGLKVRHILAVGIRAAFGSIDGWVAFKLPVSAVVKSRREHHCFVRPQLGETLVAQCAANCAANSSWSSSVATIARPSFSSRTTISYLLSD